jgi:hypothetical protein
MGGTIMEDKKISTEEFEKQREGAIKQIVNLLNKYDLTVVIEHSIKILPKRE